MHPSPRWPGEEILDHLVFALKNEGLNLLILKAIFSKIGSTELEEALRRQPGSSYARRLGFIYEWLLGRRLQVPDSRTGNYVAILDGKHQFTGREPVREKRFRILNNLPGTSRFCPLVARTQVLDSSLAKDLSKKAELLIKQASPDVLARAAAFLLLSDSKASFEIEKERPSRARLERWGAIIGRAGLFDLEVETLVDLQREVIGDDRFVTLGVRREGGFVGSRELFNEPVPEHISARPEDLPDLLEGLIQYDIWSEDSQYHPVFAAAALAFGFVYIHPFEDGNGRIHRFLIHHVLAYRGYTPREIIFPISNAILDDLLRYRTTLESVSKPLLPFIDWNPTEKGNIEVRNDTADFYRYFDATRHAEFLFGCLERTISDDLPKELRFLEARDQFHKRATQIIDMPEKTIDLLLHFLRQGNGRLSRRAVDKEFGKLKTEEISAFEEIYEEVTDIP